jgi:hypothetical protein
LAQNLILYSQNSNDLGISSQQGTSFSIVELASLGWTGWNWMDRIMDSFHIWISQLLMKNLFIIFKHMLALNIICKNMSTVFIAHQNMNKQSCIKSTLGGMYEPNN